MKKFSHLRVFASKNLIYLVAIGIFSILFFLATHQGLKTTYDSLQYESAAVSFEKNKQLLMQNGDVYRAWPPLYPTLLALAAPHYVKEFAKWVNLFTILGSLVIWIHFSQAYLTHSFSKWIYALLLSSATPLLLISHFLWSESVFVFLVSVYIYYIFKYIQNLKTSSIAIASLAGFLMLLQRHAGIFILTGAIIGVLAIATISKKLLLTLSLHFAFISIGWLIWITKIGWVEEILSLGKHTYGSENTIYVKISYGANSFWYFSNHLIKWFLPQNYLPISLKIIVFFLFFGGTVRMAYLLLKQHVSFIRFITIIAFTYFIIYGFIGFVYESDLDRFLAIIFPMVSLIACYGIEKQLKPQVAFILISFWCIYSFTKTLYHLFWEWY